MEFIKIKTFYFAKDILGEGKEKPDCEKNISKEHI